MRYKTINAIILNKRLERCDEPERFGLPGERFYICDVLCDECGYVEGQCMFGGWSVTRCIHCGTILTRPKPGKVEKDPTLNRWGGAEARKGQGE
jgi:ribosomal protein S27E